MAGTCLGLGLRPPEERYGDPYNSGGNADWGRCLRNPGHHPAYASRKDSHHVEGLAAGTPLTDVGTKT